MSNQTKLPQKPVIAFSDPHQVPVQYTDWVINCGMHKDLANINLGVIDHSMRSSEADPLAVTVVAKLRFTRALAENLHSALGSMLGVDAKTSAAIDPAQFRKAN